MSMKRFVTILVLIYTLMPFDLIPDTIIGWGWLDDIALWILLWRYYYRESADVKTGERPETDEKNSDRFAENQHKPSPYDVLGISEDASQEDIRRAYRELANKYHPDKVAHLGEEFGVLAEKRFKEIQEAYETLISG